MLQPFLVVEPSEGMTAANEAREWQTFMSACGRDGLTGDRLLLLRIEPPADGNPGLVVVMHIAACHAFDVPEAEWPGIEQISKLVSVPVIYKFRNQPELVYRGVITDGSDSAPELGGEGAELWISRFGRAHRPNPHINAMRPVSRNVVQGTSPADVFVIDLTRFEMPASNNCVICAQPLAGTKHNREHVVPDWLRSAVADHLGVPVDGVVAAAHESCNTNHGPGEEAIRGFTARHLSGEDLTDDELGAVAYWMTGRMVLLDRAAGIEPPAKPPLELVHQVVQNGGPADLLRPTRRRCLPALQDARHGTLDLPPVLVRGRVRRASDQVVAAATKSVCAVRDSGSRAARSGCSRWRYSLISRALHGVIDLYCRHRHPTSTGADLVC